jgi:hypothetical protein
MTLGHLRKRKQLRQVSSGSPVRDIESFEASGPIAPADPVFSDYIIDLQLLF